MPLTPETLTRHELAGLPVRVAAADNPDLVGIAGRVARETMQTLLIDCGAELPSAVAFGADCTGVTQVPKAGATFEFALPTTAENGDHAAASPTRTDEAAADRKAAGSASELGSETAGVRPGQSGPFPESGTSRHDGECEGAVYVTVDGATLLSRPATRTERAGDSTWH